MQDAFEELLLPQLHLLTINTSQNTSNGTMKATYDRTLTEISEGMPLYFGPMQVFRDAFVDGEWSNETYPL